MNALSSKYSVAIYAALSIGKKTLNHYYEKTDFLKTYCIAMGIVFLVYTLFLITYHSFFSVLHPCHKLNYFKNVRWENDWIKAARQLVQDKFNLLYNHCPMSQGLMSSHRVHTTINMAFLLLSHYSSSCA